MRKHLMRLYWPVEKRLVPGLRYSMSHFEEAARDQIDSNTCWLDVGCGHHFLANWKGAKEEQALVHSAARVVGIDLDLEALSRHRSFSQLAMANAGTLPFPDETFNLVTANMVMEHIENPVSVFAELARVLGPGGVLLFHTPNSKALSVRFARLVPDFVKRPLVVLTEGRTNEDVFHTHYAVNTAREIQDTAQATGFEVARLEYVLTTALTAAILPLAIVELLYARWLQQSGPDHLRPNIIAMLTKKAL